MSEILFLAHRVPFPPDRGDKIRSHNILKALAEIAPVHVATFGDTDDDIAQVGALSHISESYCLLRRTKPLWKAGLEALARREPVSMAAFRDQHLAKWISETLKSRPISAVYVFSGQMARYVPASFTGRVLLDLVDVDSAKFEAYSLSKPWPLSAIHAREGRLLAIEEARMARRADHTLLVSEEEAALFQARCPNARDVRVMTNGIDADFFDPATTLPHPDLKFGGPHLIFTGQMDYPPNIAAAKRAIEHIFPAVRKVYPDAGLHIVGRAPPPELIKFDGKGGVRVWGSVPDVRPFLAAAQVALVPLDIARGVQNKVLEAMAMGRPVLATSGAVTGTGAKPGRHVIIGDSDGQMIAEAVKLLADPESGDDIGRSAREFVVANRAWPATLATLPDLVGSARRRRDAA